MNLNDVCWYVFLSICLCAFFFIYLQKHNGNSQFYNRQEKHPEPMHYILYAYFPYIPKVLTPCTSYPTQKEAVPGLEPEKNWSGARQCQAPDGTTNCTIYTDAGRSSELVLQKWHGCLNTFCTLLTLFCMILLYYYYQWLYYKKSTVTVTKV